MAITIQLKDFDVKASPVSADIVYLGDSANSFDEIQSTIGQLMAGSSSAITELLGLTGYLQAPLGIKASAGNIILGFGSDTSAVNYLSVVAAATGGNAKLMAVGTDASVGLTFIAQLAGTFAYSTTATSNVFTIHSGTSAQHGTTFAFANTAQNRTVTFQDLDGTMAYTGTLVVGNVVKASATGTIADAGFALKAGNTAAYAGGGTSNAYSTPGTTALSIVTAVILTSTNAVAIAKAVPTSNTLTVTFTSDPGAGTVVSWIAITPSV